jgi:hypothetical protein
MKSTFKIQYHPNQEDKSGNPNYASGTQINYSTNKLRLEDDAVTGNTGKTKYMHKLLDKFRKKFLKWV